MERIKFINQKRTTLKSQITILENAVTDMRLDSANEKMRLTRITELFRAYEDLHDELAVIDPENERLAELNEIQDRYYALASKLETVARSSTSSNQADLNVTSLILDKTRRIKLPVAELPKFEGHLDQWLSFKNTFVTMIHSRDDITNLQKFLYLKDSLRGDALNKIAIYNVSEENYGNAWNLLIGSYEKKRILIANHLDAILDLPAADKATPKGLTKLADDMRQHVNMLASLEVIPDDHLLIRILERALPMETRAKWEESLDLDIPPTLEILYKFIAETSFRLMTIEQNSLRSGSDNCSKRRHVGKEFNQLKTRKNEQGVRAFVSATSVNCSVCKGENHPLFKCSDFAKMTVAQRWEVIKKLRLCRNCLKSHNDKCVSSRCKTCGAFHHTSLHNVRKWSAPSKQVPRETAPANTALQSS